MPEREGNRLLMGRIGAAHGIKGEVRIQSFTDDPLALAGYGELSTNRQGLTVTIEAARTTTNVLIARLKGVADRNAAEALNGILNRTVYQHQGEGGTIVIPGHGYVADEHEVVEYRDMIAIVRDRVRALIDKGATLDQVRAARPTADYDTRYGATSGPWTTEMFVEAVYRDLSRRK